MPDGVVRIQPRSPVSKMSALATLGARRLAWFAPKQSLKGNDMARISIHSDADEFAALFVGEHLNVIARHFQFPVIVYVGKQILILKDEEQLVSALSTYRSVLSDEGLSLVASNVVDRNCASHGPCKVSVENHYYSTDGCELGTARINYFGEKTGSGRKIRMVEYLKWPCQEQVARCEELQGMLK